MSSLQGEMRILPGVSRGSSYISFEIGLKRCRLICFGTIFVLKHSMKYLCWVLTLLIGTGAAARVNVRNTKPLLIPVDRVSPRITSKQVAEIIPTDVKATDSTGSVMNRIMDRSLNYWYNNSGFKESAIGRVAEETQEKLKTDVVVKGASPKATTHKFSFRIEAFQALAKVEYTGWMRAMVDYNAQKAQTNFAVREKIWKDKDLVVSHSMSSREGVSSMGVGWSW